MFLYMFFFSILKLHLIGAVIFRQQIDKILVKLNEEFLNCRIECFQYAGIDKEMLNISERWFYTDVI